MACFVRVFILVALLVRRPTVVHRLPWATVQFHAGSVISFVERVVNKQYLDVVMVSLRFANARK
jgi:hypothetical protein